MAKPKYSLDQLVNVRSYQASAAGLPLLKFSPDGSNLIYITNTSGQFNLWRHPLDGSLPVQLTSFYEQALRQAAYSPDGNSIIFTADTHGDEFHQIYLMPSSGGSFEKITDSPTAQHYLGAAAWSPDGRRVAFFANDRIPTDFDICVLDVKSREVKRFESGGKYYGAAYWSPDGRYLTVTDNRWTSDTSILLLDTKTAKFDELTPHEGMTRYVPGPWATDGSGFWMVSDEAGEFLSLAFFDIELRKHEWVETPECDIEGVLLSNNGSVLLWIENDEGYSRLKARSLETKKEIRIPEIPNGVILAATISEDGKTAGVILSTPVHPGEVLVIDLPKGRQRQITYGFVGDVNDTDLIKPKVIRYKSFDDRKVPAFLFKPKGSGKFPVVLAIHGGPEAQERPFYNPLYQYLLSRGIGVLATNIRGSTGYGKSYQRLIHRDWGGSDLKDWDYAYKYLLTLDWVDEKKIAVYGGSYGGFASLTCATRLPNHWIAAVDIVGPSNLVTFARAVPPAWKRFIPGWVGDPETEQEFLMGRSPITYADQVKCPMFIIQGAKDPRVVKPESDQFVERLKDRGVEVRYDVYEDEGHGFTKQTNRVRFVTDVAAFLEEKLGG